MTTAERELTDDAIIGMAVQAADELDATRVHEMCGKDWRATTIFTGDSGLLRFARLVEKHLHAGWQARAGYAAPPRELIADANRYHWLCDHPDWSFIESLCRSFIADTASDFYRALNTEIDRRRADVARRGPLTAQLDGWETAAPASREGGCPVCGDDACPGNHPAGSVVTRASAPPHEGDDEHA